MATNTSTKRKVQKTQALIRLLIVAAILVGINMIAARYHRGLDLTKEKRFTLSAPTKKLLSNLDDVVVVDVYLDGDFPAGFQRLKEATIERLQSFRDIAGGNIVFKVYNPLSGKSDDEKGRIFQNFADKGITGLNLKVQDADNGYSEKFVFPYALVKFNGREEPVKLLDNYVGLNALENLNYSESMLEYKFANAINKLKKPTKPEIAYLMGNGEALGLRTIDLLSSLPQYYKVDTVDLTNSLFIPSTYSAVIINRPTIPFTDKDKFKIDQYVMNGGHVLWAVDQIHTPMDSLMVNQQFIAMDMGLTINDLLFKYGARINYDLVEDIACLPIPVTVGMQGDRPQIELRSWIYYPVFGMESKHPIVKNMNYTMGRFVSSIDTIKNPEISKTILLQSSQYSRVAAAPLRVSLSMLKYPADPKMFTKPNQPTAVLLEGKFRSLFKNRLHPDFLAVLKDSLKRDYKASTDTATSMIVISDGDFMLNDFSSKRGPSEMGYWEPTNDRFANKEFVLNCLEYMTDNSGLLTARSKDTKLRQMDPNRIKAEGTQWQIINIGIPLAYVALFASIFLFYRKRRYEKVMTKKD